MLFQGLPHQGQQCRQCLLVNAIQNQVAHARFPKFVDVRGNAALGFFLIGEGGEKFANLIVRECCIALNPMLRDMISRGQGVDMIKLHFGIDPKEITTRMLDTAIAQLEQQLADKKHSGTES
jgi:hypothetical protein